MADEGALIDVAGHLKENNIQHTRFIEEDLGREVTAIATAPLVGKERRPLAGYKLLK